MSLHLKAARACPTWSRDTLVTILCNENPWKPRKNSKYGHQFGNAMLETFPVGTTTSMGQLMALEAKHLGPYKSQDHIKWLYTWGQFIAINGKIGRHFSVS
jgi:hypothetical protein